VGLERITLARAHRWNRMLEAVKFRSTAEKVDRSFVSRLLRLTLLAPDIQEAILEGRQAKGLQLEELTRGMRTDKSVISTRRAPGEVSADQVLEK
jgi:ribosome-binding protein aMBF1 (putative translation factor)